MKSLGLPLLTRFLGLPLLTRFLGLPLLTRFLGSLALLTAAPVLAAQQAPIGSLQVMRRMAASPQPERAFPERALAPAIELADLAVSVERHGDVAQTRVEHDFVNHSGERLEGSFRFPLPAGAEITGLSMEVDGRMVEGALVERQKAERIYEKIVDEMRDPALLTWETGHVFKLRVFPIEPHAHKRIVIRYLTPIEQHRYVFSAQAAQPVGRFRFTFDGKLLHDEAPLRPRDVIVDVPGASPRALVEQLDGASYLKLELPVAVEAPPKARGPQRWAVVVDVSRSALEARPLALEAVRAALSALPAGDSFTLLACDIQCRETPYSHDIDAALAFLEALDFDGATDLGAALERAAGRGTQVLYIGDGNATWGLTDPAELAAKLEPLYAAVPLHAVVLGKYARPALLTRLSNRSGGLYAAPVEESELTAFARALGHLGRAPRVSAIQLSAKDAIVSPSQPASIDAGETLTVFVRAPKLPSSVHLHALVNGRPLDRELPIGDAVASRDVARRFAGARIRELEAEGGHDDEVLALSLRHQVLSSKTAWLVLESEEAYRRNRIERAQKDPSAEPAISGRDLESTGDAVSGDHPVDGEGPEPELWLLAGLLAMALSLRKRAVA